MTRRGEESAIIQPMDSIDKLRKLLETPRGSPSGIRIRTKISWIKSE